MTTLRRVRDLGRQLAGRRWVGAYDPDGIHYGLPTYPYRLAPDGLATIRQLRAAGLRPGGQQPAAQILWRRGTRIAYLYRIDGAAPKRTATPAQLAAIARALTARRTCHTCGQIKPYYISRHLGECIDCAYPDTAEEASAYIDCVGCIGSIIGMSDGLWVHEDGLTLCLSAMPNLGWPKDILGPPAGYEHRAACYAYQPHPDHPAVMP